MLHAQIYKNFFSELAAMTIKTISRYGYNGGPILRMGRIRFRLGPLGKRTLHGMITRLILLDRIKEKVIIAWILMNIIFLNQPILNHSMIMPSPDTGGTD